MENISVSVRVRPLNRQEENTGQAFAWKLDGNSISQLEPSKDRTKYVLDNVFGPSWTTERIYEVTTQDLIQKMVKGFNSTVFAYGQTSSGKTHTMRGTADSPGIIPLAVAEAFRLIEGDEAREFLIRMSYMEIYNEDINDLLAPENEKLAIRESPESGPYVCGLREEIITGPEQVLQLLETGEVNRHVGSTKMNEKSSRSHTIFRMVVESRAIDAESDDAGAVLVSALTLVDLAGSERVAKTGAEGIRMKEGTAINKSLLTLGNVINKLSEGALASGSHIPYRDSKLTRILQPSLGGNAKTAIICAMTPAACHAEESHITLRFACRAKSVVNNATVNEVLSDAAVLKRQAKEIEELKKKLAAGVGGACAAEDVLGLRAQLLRAEQEKELLKAHLQEEQLEKERALQHAERYQKEAENTKKLFFKPQKETAEGSFRKNNRRETWCPGKSAWAMPLENTPEASETPTNSGSGQRKRCHTRMDGAGQSRATAGLSTLAEEDEEDGDVADGPSPQRRRRECSVVSDYAQEEENEEHDNAFDIDRSLERIMASASSQDRAALSLYVQQHQTAKERVEALEQELVERERSAAQQAASERSALDALTQQLEQAKWQARMSEKKAEELQALCRTAEQERDALAASHVESASFMDAKCSELSARCKDLADKYASVKEQAQGLKAELFDARTKLERRDYDYGKLESKEAESRAKLEELEAKLRQKIDEVDGVKAMMQAAEERTDEAEKRARVLYDEVKRLELHVQELESRKRAPLYQKKQEEELKAAVEKAQECEVRAIEAELRAKELRASMEILHKEMAGLQETSSAAARQAAEAQQELIERHALELQRLAAEGTLQREHHDELVATLRMRVDELEAAMASLEEHVRGKDQQLAVLQEDAAALRVRIAELEAREAELQSCAVAAQEKIAHLEHTAEAEASAHEATLVALAQQHKDIIQTLEQTHKDALSSAADVHSQALALLESQLAEAKASATHLQDELRIARDRAEQLVKASLDQSQAATAAQVELQRQVAELSAKVQEASGALKAKEELKEERLRSKQEIASLKGELQKLQLESKTGAKGKDLAQKELEALKKRLTDTEAKLRTALQDKTAALQEKGNVERQLKQFQSQKLMIEKTLEKKDAIENKKRESIMVKSKEQLNSVEERLKGVQVELQRLQMDYHAKQCECGDLEEQLNEQRAQNARLTDDNGKLGFECDDLRHQLECLSNQYEEADGQRQATLAELEQVRARLEQKETEFDELRSRHEVLLNESVSLQSAVEVARQALQDLEKQASQQQADLHQEIATHIEDKRSLDCSLKAAQEALAAAQAELADALTAHAHSKGLWQSAQAELEAKTSNLKQREADLTQLQQEVASAGEAEERCRTSLSEMRSKYDALLTAMQEAQAARAAEEVARLAAEGLEQEARAEVARLQRLLEVIGEERQALSLELAGKQESLVAAQADMVATKAAHASQYDKLQRESASELKDINAAMLAASQRAEVLEAELAVLRAQLEEARMLGASATNSTDLTRSRSAGGMTQWQPLDELQQQLNALTAANEELETTVFSMAERQDAAQKEQLQLKSQLADVERELVERYQQAAELEHKCAGLEAELVRARQQAIASLSVANESPTVLTADHRSAAALAEPPSCLTGPLRFPESERQDALNPAVQRDDLARQLAEALAIKEELERKVAEYAHQHEQLLRDLKVQLETRPPELPIEVDEKERTLLAAQEDAEGRVLALQTRIAELQADMDQRMSRLQLITLQYSELQQRHVNLENDCSAMKQELAALRACPPCLSLTTETVAAPGCPVGVPGARVHTEDECRTLRDKVTELLQRQADLEAEMSDVQASCNMAIAEKRTLEQAMNHRVLELETANIRLGDELARLRDEHAPRDMSHFMYASTDTDALLNELEGLRCQVQQLTVSLENAVTAKEDISKRLGAELEGLRSALADADDVSKSQLLESERKLMIDLRDAQERVAALQQDAVTAGVAAHATAAEHEPDDADDSKRAPLTPLLSYDELAPQHAQLQRELAEKSADVEALSARLAQANQKHKEADARGDYLESLLEDLRVELLSAKDALAAITTSRDEAAKRLTEAEVCVGSCHQLELQASSLQAAVTRLTNEAAEAKRTIASLESEAQELLDANTLLESQVRELRAGNAALQAQLSALTSEVDRAETVALEARLQESEWLRSKLEQQVTELAQQMSVASAQHRAGARERSELESDLLAAKEAHFTLENQLAAVVQTCKDLQEENRALDDELQALRVELKAADDGHRNMERIHELESQLELQEKKHRLATQKLQDEMVLLHKHLDERQREFASAEESLRHHIQELTTAVERLQDSHEEMELAAKQREAELNAEKLELGSQIHWLKEQNQRLQQPTEAAAPTPSPNINERLQSLEDELRRSKRAEIKLQGLLFCIRKDVEAIQNGTFEFDKLLAKRSEQYDVDMLTEKCKRLHRELQARDQQVAALTRGNGGKAPPVQPTGSSVSMLADKENLPCR